MIECVREGDARQSDGSNLADCNCQSVSTRSEVY
jgi:hypothetical protein